jgi:hypothetical protein
MTHVATWYGMECDHGHTWVLFSEDDIEPTEDQMFCPEAGHPAILYSKSPLDRYVRISIAAAGPPSTSQGGPGGTYFLELSTWDRQHHVLSKKTYTWDEAVKRAEYFHNLPWDDAERRWHRLRM